MENQGKRKSQMKDSETFAIIALIAALIAVLLLVVSCNTSVKATPPQEEEKVYINIDGQQVEMVSDDYGNQYLKYRIDYKKVVFVPFPFETEEETDSLKFFNAKNK